MDLLTVAAIKSWMNYPLFQFGGSTIKAGELILALVFVVAIWWVASLIERGFQRLTLRYVDEPWKQARMYMFSRFLRYGAWGFGTLLGLNYLGKV